MRIIIVSQTYSPGNGQASFTIQLAENMAKSGHQVMVLTPASKMLSCSTYKNGVHIEEVPALHLSVLHPSIFITPFPLLSVKKLFKTFRPDVVHIQDHYFLCSAAVNEARRLGIPLIGTNHFLPENILPFFKNFPKIQHLFTIPLWKMMLSVFNKLDVTTTPSKTAARILKEQAIHTPVHAISNGVDTNRFHPDPEVNRSGIRQKYGLDPEKPLFLYMGRLDGEKRLDIMLDAFSLLQRENLQLALGGYGLYEQILRKQMQDLGLSGRVKFIGFVQPQDLPDLYNSADIFVMPSPEELQSIATLEAMACGKPVLAANARALPELVQTDVNGYLFKANNAQDAARGIEHLLNIPGRWNEMGRVSCELAQRHSLQSSIQRYEENYRIITQGTHARSRHAIPTRTRKVQRKYT
jgi:glycosyltransferase involved in cell wall biosynthesis